MSLLQSKKVVALFIFFVFRVRSYTFTFYYHRDRVGNAALDFNFPDLTAIGTQYSAPSTRANSELSLSSRTRLEYAQTHKLMPTPTMTPILTNRDKYKQIDKPMKIKTIRDRQTQV